MLRYREARAIGRNIGIHLGQRAIILVHSFDETWSGTWSLRLDLRSGVGRTDGNLGDLDQGGPPRRAPHDGLKSAWSRRPTPWLPML